MYEETKTFLETQYPAWNFHWETVGNQIRGFCPNHSDTHKPNLYIADKGNGEFFKCFACGFRGNAKTLLGYTQSSLQTKILTNLANLFADALTENKCINAKIANAYLNFRNPHLSKLINNNLLVGVVSEEFNLTSLKLETTATEEEKAQFDKILNDFKSIISLAQYNVPLCFFYTNTQGLVEQIKFRHIYSKPRDITETDIENIDFSKERGGKQFSIIQTGKQTENAFGLHLYNNNKHKLFTFVTEGEFNTLSFLGQQYEIDDCSTFETYRIISIGSTENLEKNYNLLKKIKSKEYNLIFALDNDNAGKNALLNFINKHSEFVNAKILLLDNVKDFDEYIAMNDFFRAGEFYKDIEVKDIKDILPLWNLQQKQQEDEEVEKIIQNAKKYGFEWMTEALSENITKDSVMMDLYSSDEDDENNWLIKDILYENTVNILAGLGGAGKTTLSLQWLLHLLLNMPLSNNIGVKQINKVTIISAEEDVQMITKKTIKLLEYFSIKTGIKINDLKQQLQNKIQLIMQNNILTEQEFGKVVKTQEFDVVKSSIDTFNPDMVLIDSLTSINIVKIQDSVVAQGIMRYLQEITNNRTCILLHHLTKDSVNAEDITKIAADKILGSASLTNKVRQVLLLYKQGLKVVKSNLLPLDSINNYYYQLENTKNLNGDWIYGFNFKKITQKEAKRNDQKEEWR